MSLLTRNGYRETVLPLRHLFLETSTNPHYFWLFFVHVQDLSFYEYGTFLMGLYIFVVLS